MHTKRLLLILTVLLLAGSVYAQKKKQKRSVPEEIERMIDESKSSDLLNKGDLIIAFIDSAQSKYITRISNTNSGKLATELTFELGDLTQVFTSLLVHELAADGKLDLKKSINDLLPIDFQSVHFRNVSLQDCLSHTSGLPRLPNNLGTRQLDHNQPFEHYKPSDLAAFIKQWKPSNNKKAYQYSLIGYELVDIILQHQFDKSYDQMIQGVLNPIYGFETLTAAYTESAMNGRNKVGNEVAPMRFSSFVSSSGLRGSVSDLVHLLIHSKSTSRTPFCQTLEIQSPTGIDQSVSIASGWHHFKVNRHHDFYLHKGSTKGFSSFMAYNQSSETGVVILSSTKVNLGPMGYYIMGKLNKGWKK